MARQHGFTLIELMIALVVVGILATVAMPSYNNYVIRSRLVEAQSSLASGRVRTEQFYQDNRTYIGMTCPPATATFAFNCGAPAPTATTYTITATGLGFTFTINQDNARATTTAASGWPTSATCWTTSTGGC